MGVRGLSSYIKSKGIAKEVPLQRPLRGSHIHVDGNGFIFALLNHQQEHELQCSYAQYRYNLKRELSYLINDLGMSVVVYFDGSERKFKQKTDDARDYSRLDTWIQLYDILAKNLPWKRRDIPKPVLLYDLVRGTLREMNVKVVNCIGEADQEMALVCNRERDKGLQSFVYAEDSDFWLMKGIGYIPFAELMSIKKTTNTKKGVIVWTRAVLASILKFPTEAVFVEWCLILGNDYTGGIDPSLFVNVPSNLLDRGNPDRFDILKDFLLEQGSDFQVSSDNKEVQAAITYSRMLYNLEEISSFSIPVDDVQCSDHRDAETGSPMTSATIGSRDTMWSLSERHVTKINSVVESHLANLPAKILPLSSHEVGIMVVDFWGVVLLMHRPPETSTSKENNASFLEIDLSDHLNPQFLQALRDMVNMLAESKDNEPTEATFSIQSNSKACKVPTSTEDWDIFLAAHVYQLSCKAFLYALRKNIAFARSNKLSRGTHQALLQNVWPHQLYDPHVFVTCLRNIQAEDAKLARSKNTNKMVNEYMRASIQTTGPSMLPITNTTNKNNNRHDEKEAAPLGLPTLPIDAYRIDILTRIARDRVTIIHGETGCGKSSRLPHMLLEEAEERHLPCTMMVSQPRRLAASSLYKRVHQSLGDKVGLRMGHGIKQETDLTQIFFVTTGYLVRLLAHHPSVFDHHTHLIIDEVHERSVDSDVLCLLAKRLLQSNPRIRVVLMSATIHVELYQKYFQPFSHFADSREVNYGSLECLSVGMRRFPIQVQYLEDLEPLVRGMFHCACTCVCDCPQYIL